MPVPSQPDDRPQERVWKPHWPCPVPQMLGTLRHGGGDPTYRVDPDRTIWRAIRTPAGPATIATRPMDAAGEVLSRAWGPGADWALDQLPATCGAEDDPSGFRPQHDVLEEAWRTHPHFRVPRSGLVLEALVPAVIEQKVTGKEAFGSWRAIVWKYGTPAPGPEAERRRLLLSPSPDTLRAIPSWTWLNLHVDPARSRTVVTVAKHARALERIVDLPLPEADKRLRSLPGVGVWTSAEVRQRALGDADAISFGDYHVAKDVTWALTGRPQDDTVMERLLEPYVGHRFRVQVLVGSGGLRRPRRAPRMTLPTHLPSGVGRPTH